MIINHNLGAMNALRNMNVNSANANKSMQKLSSGLRINSAADDAAGLAISEKMRGQIRGLDQASSNAQDAISLIQTGEGALNETTSILQRMRELAVQSASDTNIGTDREQIQSEMDQLATEISRISNTTEFNQKNLLGGHLDDTYQVGANKDQNIELTIGAMDAKTLGVAVNKTTTSGVTAGDVNTATFANTVGANVVDGATVTFQYTAANSGSPATASTITGAGNVTPADLSANDGTMTIQVGATTFTVSNATIQSWNGSTTIGDITTALQNASDGGTGKLSDVVTVSNDGSKITLTAKTAGATAVTVDYTGTGTAAIAGVTGIADGATDTGDALVPPASAKITVSDGSVSQDIDITDAAATSFSVTSGIFNGISISADAGKTLADLDSVNDKVTLSQTISTSSEATFAADGTMTEAKVAAGIDVSTQPAANNAIKTINDAIEKVSSERAKLGAYQNRLEHTIANLGTSSENLTSAESRIRDVDMAKEMSTFSKNNILSQAAQAMLAQANQQPQQVLQLLR